MLTLVCPCGLKLRAPGAVPGRVGKCPRCGSLFRVPEPPPEPPPTLSTTTATAATSGPGAFRQPRGQERSASRRPSVRTDGLVRGPGRGASWLADSVTYPLRNASGIGVLIFLPPLLWLTTALALLVKSVLLSGVVFMVIGVVLLAPLILLAGVTAGYACSFLGEVLISSAAGAAEQPRAPEWDVFALGGVLVRWSASLAVAGVVGGGPAVAYWIRCGAIDTFDRIVLVDLLLPGLAYAQMGLVAALMRGTPLAANPLTVGRAIARVGWGYVGPCVLTAGVVVVLVGGLDRVLRLASPVVQAVACWLFWVVALYALMVVFRYLGLFCHRHAARLCWFPRRPKVAADPVAPG